jgi:hypothetical protein
MAAGCVTAEELDQRLSGWVGQDADTLALAWGAPTGSYQKKDGGRILSYEKASVMSTGGAYSQTYSRHCRVDFVTDKDGRIVSAKWLGAADQCDRSISPL